MKGSVESISHWVRIAFIVLTCCLCFIAVSDVRIFLQSLSTMLDLSERMAGKGETAGNVRWRQHENYYVDLTQLGRAKFKF